MSKVNDTFDTGSQVNLLEHQTSSPSPKQRRNLNLIKIFFCLVIFLALTTGAILLSLIHKQTVDSQIQFNLKQTTEAVEIFCSTTLHLPECITFLSSSIARNGRKKVDPDYIFSVSLILANNEVNNLASLTKSLILISTGSRSIPALQQCASLIDDSLDKLNRSLTTSAPGYSMLPHEKIRDLILWVNGSVSANLRACFDLVIEDESRAVDDGLRVRVHRAMIYASNSFEFLRNRDDIIAMMNSRNSEPVDYEYLSILCMFCPQYLVLLLLYFLLLRKY